MQAVVLLPAHTLCVRDRFAVTTLPCRVRCACTPYGAVRRPTVTYSAADDLTTSESCERRAAPVARVRGDISLIGEQYHITLRPRRTRLIVIADSYSRIDVYHATEDRRHDEIVHATRYTAYASLYISFYILRLYRLYRYNLYRSEVYSLR